MSRVTLCRRVVCVPIILPSAHSFLLWGLWSWLFCLSHMCSATHFFFLFSLFLFSHPPRTLQSLVLLRNTAALTKSMSVQLAAQDFATPDKGGPNNMTASTMDASYTQHKGSVTQTTSKAVSTHSVTPMETGQKDPNSSTKQPNTVTPHGSHPTAGGKQVRFGAEETKDAKPVPAESPANAKRGPVSVSRRGGRFVSPARSVAANTSAPSSAPAPSGTVAPKEQSVLEYTTFRPAAKSDNDSTPTLSSANSVGLVSMPSESEKDNEHNTGNSSTKKGKTEGSFAVDSRRPTSISYGQSNLQTSPLAKSSPQKECPSFDDEAKSLIRSPVPTQSYERVSLYYCCTLS